VNGEQGQSFVGRPFGYRCNPGCKAEFEVVLGAALVDKPLKGIVDEIEEVVAATMSTGSWVADDMARMVTCTLNFHRSHHNSLVVRSNRELGNELEPVGSHTFVILQL